MSPASSADLTPATHLVFGQSKPDPPRPPADTRRHSRRSSLAELLKSVGDAGGESDDESSAIMAAAMAGEPYCQMVELGRSVPFLLQFKNLSYSVKNRTKWKRPAFSFGGAGRAELGEEADKYAKTKTILDDVSGEARDGEILAVLGQSGSGKSTLIDALADRIAKGSLKGNVTLNGETMDSGLLKTISAYVMQDDLLYPMLTVEETLMFSAEFRLPSSLSTAKKAARVQALIDQLGLRSAARTVIGDEGHRGVSGGERRRVSIGIDIIHDPIVLFLDEPTSGLDSTSAFMVVQVLQRIARSGSIVVLTIHQPSYRIVGLLDQMIFLSRGQTVYTGPPSELPVFFDEFGNPIPDGENRTEFALDFIRELESSPDGTRALVDFHRSWQSRSTMRRRRPQPETRLTLNEAISASISRGKLVTSGGGDDGDGGNTHRRVAKFANPWWAEAWVLSRRSMTNARRSPELFGVRLGAVLVTGFILATIFWRLDSSPRGVQERLGFFAYASATIFFTCAEALPVFIMERFIFMRETAYNAYRRSSYVLSNAVVSFPSLVALSLAFSSVTFWSVGLAGGVLGFAYFFAVILASFWAGASFVTFLSGVVSNYMMGYTVVIASLANFLLLSGFFITRDRIPAYWIWLHYLSLVKYPYEGVMHNELDDPRKCFVRGGQIFDNTPLGSLPEASKARVLSALSRALGVNITARSCVTTGVDILRQAAVTDLTRWGCIWVLLAWGFFFRIVFYFSLLLGSKNKRR